MLMNEKLLLNLFLILCLSSPTWAQNKQVTGTVTDAISKAPISGVSITVPGTVAGTTTDNAGQFSLQLAIGTNSIQVSAVNYQTQTIHASGEAVLLISLTIAAKGMDEVVVVGYGTQRKKDLTGAVSTIGARDVGGRQTI